MVYQSTSDVPSYILANKVTSNTPITISTGQPLYFGVGNIDGSSSATITVTLTKPSPPSAPAAKSSVYLQPVIAALSALLATVAFL